MTIVRRLIWPTIAVNVACIVFAAQDGDTKTFAFALFGCSFAMYAWLFHLEEQPSTDRLEYRDIASRLRWDIKEEGLIVGRRLPAIHELAIRFNSSRIIVSRALEVLEEEGLVQRVDGEGTYILSNGDPGTRIRRPRT